MSLCNRPKTRQNFLYTNSKTRQNVLYRLIKPTKEVLFIYTWGTKIGIRTLFLRLYFESKQQKKSRTVMMTTKQKNNNQTLFSHSKRRTKSPCRTSVFQITKLNLSDCFFIIIWIWGGVVVFVLPPLLLLRSAHEKTSARRNATKSKIGWPHRSVAG